MDFRGVIKEVGRGAHGARALSREDAQRLFAAMLDGEVPDMELGAIVLAYRIKGESVEELQGFTTAMSERTLRVECAGDVKPVLLPSYNGARKLPNLTALVAMLLARRGVPVLIHGTGQGDRDPYGRVTTAEVLEQMGIPVSHDTTEAAAALQKRLPAYLPVGVLCAGLARLLDTRARLGVRGSAHTLAKMLDPFSGRSVRVVPLTHPAYFDTMRPCLVDAGSPAVLMRGSEGEPYAGPKRPLSIEYLSGGTCQQREEPRPDDTPLPDAIDASTTATWIRTALEGKAAIPATVLRQVEWLDAAARGC
jgi:anthranilate phosphoribosyltransferase